MNNKNNIGEFLKSLRVAKGLTQMELAEYLNVSNKTVSKWESGVGIPELSTLLILADFYDVTVDDILRGTRRVSKNIEKEKNISGYVYQRTRGQYNNILIIVFGIWLLSNIVTILLGRLTNNPTLGMVGIVIMLVGLIIQGININNLRNNAGNIDQEEKKKLFSFVFHTSYLFLYAGLSVIYFAITYNIENSTNHIFEPIIYRLFYSYGFTAVNFIILYYIIRIFKISFLNKLKNTSIILSFIVLVILLVPLVVVTVTDPYELAIQTDNSYVTYSYVEKSEEEDKYYELKYLSLYANTKANRVDISNDLRFDETKNAYIFLFDDGYELVMSSRRIDYLDSLGYVKFEITDANAKGYRVTDLSKFDMSTVLYFNFSFPLIVLYVIGNFTFVILNKKKTSQ